MFLPGMFSFLLRKRSDSSDTCVADVTMPDGLALVKLALQVAPVVQHSQNKNTRRRKAAPPTKREIPPLLLVRWATAGARLHAKSALYAGHACVRNILVFRFQFLVLVFRLPRKLNGFFGVDQLNTQKMRPF